MNARRRIPGSAQLVSSAIGLDEAATLELVECLMRQETGGVLDHLSAAAFARLARQSYGDAKAWNEIGPVNGFALADFCRVEQIDLPTWATGPTEGAQA